MSDLQKSESEFIINEQKTPDLEFLKFFDPTTMSIHLKENQKPLGKKGCLLYTSPSPRDGLLSRMPSSA